MPVMRAGLSPVGGDMSFSWDVLTDPPGFGTSTMLLLTDGRVICEQDGDVGADRADGELAAVLRLRGPGERERAGRWRRRRADRRHQRLRDLRPGSELLDGDRAAGRLAEHR